MLRRPGDFSVLRRHSASTSHLLLEMLPVAPHGIEIRATERIWSFSQLENPPASISHETFEISDFASDLDPANPHVKTITLDKTPQPIPPASISQQTDGRKLNIYWAELAQIAKT